MSNEGASTILKEMGIHVSNDTTGCLYNRLSIEDTTDIQAVGILYGRSGLANLFCKCYAAFSITQTNVHVHSLIPGLEKRIKKFTEKIMVPIQS